jgi:hypothetical protein
MPEGNGSWVSSGFASVVLERDPTNEPKERKDNRRFAKPFANQIVFPMKGFNLRAAMPRFVIS